MMSSVATPRAPIAATGALRSLDMLIVFQRPYLDARGYLETDTGRLARPSWSAADPTPERYYVRGLGGIDQRRKGAAEDWGHERVFCRLTQGLKFVPQGSPDTLSSAKTLGGNPSKLRQYCAFRRLLWDNKALARLEIGIGVERFLSTTTGPLVKNSHELEQLLELTLKLQVTTSGADQPVTLARASERFAEIYLRASTRRDKAHPIATQNWWCQAVRPLLLVEAADHELDAQSLAQSAELTIPALRAAHISLRHTAYRFKHQGQTLNLPTWIISYSPETPVDVLRRLRVNLTVVHAKYQNFHALLSLAQAGKLSLTENTPQRKRFEASLAELTDLFLFRKKYNGLPISDILKIALNAEEQAFTAEQREVVLELFEAVKLEHNLKINLQQLTGLMTPSAERNAVFVSYSHVDDKRWLQGVRTSLKPLERQRFIRYWDDGKIAAGDEWRKEIDQALAGARVAIFLVSMNFLASDFVQDVEIPKLLEAAHAEGVLILPIIVGHSPYGDSPLGKYQSLNDPKQPLSKLADYEQEEVFTKLYYAVKNAFPPPA
jgi:hypothetical protein